MHVRVRVRELGLCMRLTPGKQSMAIAVFHCRVAVLSLWYGSPLLCTSFSAAN